MALAVKHASNYKTANASFTCETIAHWHSSSLSSYLQSESLGTGDTFVCHVARLLSVCPCFTRQRFAWKQRTKMASRTRHWKRCVRVFNITVTKFVDIWPLPTIMKVCIRAKGPIRSKLKHGFCSMKWLEHFYSPLYEMIVHQLGYPPSIKFVVLIYTPVWKEALRGERNVPKYIMSPENPNHSGHRA